MSEMLRVTDLHAFYGKSHILQGVNMHVGNGEIVALLGRNGVGRSTLCKPINPKPALFSRFTVLSCSAVNIS